MFSVNPYCPGVSTGEAGISARREQLPPHQFGQMTYDRAIEVTSVFRKGLAAVSHGLTSSPQWGEGHAASAVTSAMAAHRRSLLPLGRRCPEGADEGAFTLNSPAFSSGDALSSIEPRHDSKERYGA